MLEWIRRYTSVLPREFGVLYGAANGLILGALWLCFRRPLAGLESANASLFWMGFFAAAYLTGLAFLLGAAAWLRHVHGAPHHGVQAQGALKAWLGGLRFRHMVQAYGVLMLAVMVLQRFADLTRYQAYLLSRWATVAFTVWLAVQAPTLRFRPGSPAQRLVRWALAPLLLLLAALAWRYGADY
jgi:hypothetical protein